MRREDTVPLSTVKIVSVTLQPKEIGRWKHRISKFDILLNNNLVFAWALPLSALSAWRIRLTSELTSRIYDTCIWKVDTMLPLKYWIERTLWWAYDNLLDGVSGEARLMMQKPDDTRMFRMVCTSCWNWPTLIAFGVCSTHLVTDNTLNLHRYEVDNCLSAAAAGASCLTGPAR